MSEQQAVSVDGLVLSYGDERAVDDVSFELPAGRLVGILGPNGAGKSTLIKGIVGAKQPDSGTISLFGEPASDGRRLVTYVPQRGDVDWDFPITAREVVGQGRYRSTGLLGRFGNDDEQAVTEAMKSVEIVDLADRQIGALSGGQQQRVFLARALAQGGELFVMDEPFAGVDAATETAIVNVLRQLVDQGKTVLVVHHDLVTVAEYFDYLVLINEQLIACGPTDEVFTKRHLRAAYGGHFAFLSEATNGTLPRRDQQGFRGEIEQP